MSRVSETEDFVEAYPQWVAGSIGAGVALFLAAILVLPKLSGPTPVVITVAIALGGGFGAGTLLLGLTQRSPEPAPDKAADAPEA